MVKLTPESTVEDVKAYLREHIDANTQYLEKMARRHEQRLHGYIRTEAQNNALINMLLALDPVRVDGLVSWKGL